MKEADSKRAALRRAQEIGNRLTTSRTQERRARITDAANEAEQALYDVLGLPPEAREAAPPSLVAPRRNAPRRVLKAWTKHQTVVNVRQQLSLLVTTPVSHSHVQTRAAKQQASIWASRYATHAIVLLLLFGIAMFGGFKGLTAQATTVDAAAITIDESGFAADDTLAASFEQYDPRAGNAAVKADVAMRAQLVTHFPERIKSYTVQPGDTLSTLALKFGLDIPTLMSANHLADPDAILTPGDTLLVLPVKGMYHVVNEGDTVESIAAEYQVEPAAITSYKLNTLRPPYALNVGDALIIPGGSLPPRDRIITYTPHPSETVSAIAQKFGLSVATILLANPQLGDGSNISSDMQLIVPPIDGIVYTAVDGDNLDNIARYYGSSAKVLADFAPNHLKLGDTLAAGTVLMIPGGTIPTPTPTSTVPPTDTPVPTDTPAPLVAQSTDRQQPTSRGSGRTDTTTTRPTAVPNQPAPQRPEPTAVPRQPTPTPAPISLDKTGLVHGSFIWPTGGRITQGFYSWEATGRHNGLDIANASGTAIVAADGGEVTWSGWRTDGLGYCVIIDHHNGYRTVYGHMRSQPAVSVGQWVSRGQYIGPMGTTGNSTGNHLHFMIKLNNVPRDPLEFLS